MKKLRMYVDTSVFGGCFDEEFIEESVKLFDEIKNGKFILVLSTTTVEELAKAPERVQKIFTDLPLASASVAEVDFVVSWNFKQIVHYEKISGFQAVNLLMGYKIIHIYSPREVVDI